MAFISKKQLIAREGVISGLQRATHVAGRRNTTHLCVFSLGNERVKLALRERPPIADGEHVRVCGYAAPGAIHAIACRDLTTGWISGAKTPGAGCLVAGALVFAAGAMMASAMAYGFTHSTLLACAPFAFVIPLAYAAFSFWHHRNLTLAAHAMITTTP